jgi:hypothetical protein
VRGAFVAGDVALAVVLVLGAGLMVRTVLNLMNVDAGFEQSRLVTFGVAFSAATYATFDQRVQVYQRSIDRFPAAAAHVDAPVRRLCGPHASARCDRHLRRAVVPGDAAPA